MIFLVQHQWKIINGGIIAANVVLNAIFVAANDPLRIFVHSIITLTLYPLFLASILNFLVAIPGKDENYWINYKNNYKYSVFMVMMFFAFGTLGLIGTGTQLTDWQ